MKAVTSTVMRGLDEATINAGTPGDELMERAGYGAFREILNFSEGLAGRHCTSFLILTGKGNNGGDGFVVARYLHDIGESVTVVSVCLIDELSGDARLNADRLPDEVPVVCGPESLDEFLVPGTIVVDGLLGTGITGNVREPYAEYIQSVNASGLPVVALDIPSGLNGDTGEVANVAITADLTVCMGLPKSGLFLNEGSDYSGRFRLIDIGILPEAIDRVNGEFDVTTASDIVSLIERLPAQAHKGTMGRIGIVGGSKWFPGALALAGTGCLRSGGGLVTLAFPESIAACVGGICSALIMHPVPDAGLGHHSKSGIATLLEFAGNQDAVVIGPGLSSESACIDVVTKLLELDVPIVLDADGLRAFSVEFKMPERKAPLILTPHPGEMRRLLAWIDRTELLDASRFEQATGVAETLGAYVVLKGSHTVIATPDGRIGVNTSGSPALATGGTGDVLSGMIGAFLCQIAEPYDAIRAAVFIHGFAAERVDAMRSFIADDLPESIGLALSELSPHA